MRLIETPWGRMVSQDVVKCFFDLPMETVWKESRVVRDLLFELWQVSPEDGQIAAFIISKRYPPPILKKLTEEILLRGPVMEKMTAEVKNEDALKRVLSAASDGDDLIFVLKEEEDGLLSLALLWRRIGDSFSVPAAVDELIEDIMRFKHLPGLRSPFVFSAMHDLAARAEWIAKKIFAGIKEVTLIHRAQPFREEEATKH